MLTELEALGQGKTGETSRLKRRNWECGRMKQKTEGKVVKGGQARMRAKGVVGGEPGSLRQGG